MMDLNRLSDEELVDYVIKHDTDPIRLRLAKYMENKPGAILDGLEHAGMDEVFCTFESVVNYSKYHPGEYIKHLEEEIYYLNDCREQDRKEIKDLQARSIMDVMIELRQEIKTAEWSRDEAIRDRDSAKQNEKIMKHKLNMWAELNR